MILVCEIYKKIYEIIKDNNLLSFKHDQTEAIKIFTPNYHSEKEILPESHSMLL